MDLRKWGFHYQLLLPNHALNLRAVLFSLAKEAPHGCLELVGRSSAGSDLTRPAAATEPRLQAGQVQQGIGQFFGHNCPWFVRGVRDHGTEKINVKTHEALWRGCAFSLRGCFAPLRSALFFSLPTLLQNCCHFSSQSTDQCFTQNIFLSVPHLVIELLSLFGPAYRLVHAQDMGLRCIAATPMNGASACVKALRTENAFSAFGPSRCSSH